MRRRLSAGQSVVTRDGVWLGADWLRLSRDPEPHTGVIEREESLRTLRTETARLEAEVKERERGLDLTREQVRDYEDRRDRFQGEVNRLHREHVDRRGEHDAAQARKADTARRLSQLETALADVRAELERAQTDLRSARGRMETAIDALTALEPQRVELESERERLRAEQGAARAAAQAAQQRARELALQVESRRTSHASLETTLARLEKQLQDLTQRRDDLERKLKDGEAPLAALHQELEHALALARAGRGGAARRARRERGARRAAAGARSAPRLDRRAGRSARAALDEARLAAQQVRVRRESIAEQLAATTFELPALLAGLPPEATVEAWETELNETKGEDRASGPGEPRGDRRIQGAVGAQGISGPPVQGSHRRAGDPGTAMRKIDRETRTRFQDTFDRVNAGLKEKFPRLFGGGHAYLELAEEESDAAGVSVMARPPGKRNSTISQLSGGEKALTAVALVFAIFDLNPAPFCLLDEVDAPLDDNNIGRFCDIVREMSRSVQFVFITHNKSTMEMASQLVGVTMNEPGVSRLVAVDVDEAVRMAAM